jgi:hypothetical protein
MYKIMTRKMILMAVAAFALATGARAQYYNFDVTVHQDLQPPSFSELMAEEQVITQQNTLEFRNIWVYQLSNGQKAFWARAVPGLGAAIVHGNWSAAYSFFSPWILAERGYEKKYHRPSPAWVAAHNATLGSKSR